MDITKDKQIHCHNYTAISTGSKIFASVVSFSSSKRITVLYKEVPNCFVR